MSAQLFFLINYCPQCGVGCQKNGKFCVECGVCFVKQCRSCRGDKNVCGWWERCTFCGKKMFKPNESIVIGDTSEGESVSDDVESASESVESDEEASSCSDESSSWSEESSSYSDESSSEEDEQVEKVVINRFWDIQL